MLHLGDVTKIKGNEVPAVDVITFGAPCQDLSVAGKRKGLKHEQMGDDETTRSGLFYEATRIIKEMRNAPDNNRRMACRFAIYENVYGAFSSNKGEDFRAVLEEIVRIKDKDAHIPGPPKDGWPHAGYIMGDGYSVAWRGHDAQYWGVPQWRKRICVLADFEGGQLQGYCLKLNFGEKPMRAIPTKLSQVLERNPDPKYNLSPRECQGILNRAERRGKALPEILRIALERQATLLKSEGESSSIPKDEEQEKEL